MSVLRPASLSDVQSLAIYPRYGFTHEWTQWRSVFEALQNLYDFEWRKRGFAKSP